VHSHPTFLCISLLDWHIADATGWVKKYSEIEYAKQGAKPAGSALPAMIKQPWWKPKPKKKALSTDDPQTGSDDETAGTGTTTTSTEAPLSVRATRIALVSTVVALSAYNVHLYFSQ
jgi:hypothetical protein